MRAYPAASIVLWLLSAACTESATAHVSFELRARGKPVSVTLRDGTELSLSRAQLAFGPFYLCAGAQAGPSCDTALAEWRESQVIDVLSTTAVTVGQAEGYSGRALSFMHDCGVVSLLTHEAPLVLPAAEELGGRSVDIEGIADFALDDAPDVPFRVALTIASSRAADRGQPVVRSSPGQFDEEIDPDTSSLTAVFDAAAWLTNADPEAFWQDAACEADGPAVVCAGTVSQDCASGDVVDCSASAQICAPNEGCQDAIVFDADTPTGRAVAQAVAVAAGLDVQVD